MLVFTAYSERALLQRGLESGAHGYVLKEAPHDTLLKAIEKVAAGETFVDPALIPSLATGRDGQEILTQREREILQLLADGVERRRRSNSSSPGDGEEPRAPHPGEARGGDPHPGGRHRAARGDNRLSDEHVVAERLLAERAERRRIAEQLHDGPVQHVAALSQMLDAAVAALEDGDVQMGQRVAARALAVARDAAEELRGIVAGLEPITLHEVGLAAAVREVASRTAGRRGASVEVTIAETELGEGARSSLFQVIREALDQAVRRGPPTVVRSRSRVPRRVVSSSWSRTTRLRNAVRP